MSGYSTFTGAQRTALVYGATRAAQGEADARMSQAEAFCHGHDEIAAKYDGPDGYIAFHANARSELDALVDLAYGVTS